METSPHERLIIGCFRGCLAFVMVVVLGGAGTLVALRYTALPEPPPGFLGSPDRGRAAIDRYGCASCHVIPGVAPRGMVGPPLAGIGGRKYLAGRFPNEPIAMEEWLQHPQTMKPGSAMPDLGVTDRDARDIAAYLATLERD